MRPLIRIDLGGVWPWPAPAILSLALAMSACGSSGVGSSGIAGIDDSVIVAIETSPLVITKAKWDAEDDELVIEGTLSGKADEDAAVTVYAAADGAPLGRAKIGKRNKTWKLKIEIDNGTVPCAVRATYREAEARRDVDGAPAGCGADNGGSGGGGGTGGGTTTISHVGKYTVYEGSKTCVQCHADEVADAHAAVHYQWNGPTPYVVNFTSGGKMGNINDFCGFPDINFIGQLTNLDGQVVDGGCAQCHVGLGAKPSATATTAQLENIDCLVCHSDEYRRKVEKQSDGSFRFVPAPEKMTVPLLQAITDIQRTPTKGACVNCHSYAGGGCNNKRGDMEEAHRDPPSAAFDVHMASKDKGGAGLVCVDCHVSAAHRIAGRGVDLQPTDLDVPVRCTNCHSAAPHDNATLNRHTQRVDCSVCHIPAFARIAATDMVRDFSKPAQVDEAKRLYEPNVVRAGNVIPEYKFWNGLSTFYKFGTPAEPAAGQRVLMAGPVGDIGYAQAKIYPFKHHLAVQPRSVASKYLLPLKAGILFQTGNVDAAITRGAADVGWDLTHGYDFVETERYMGIFHEVAPASNALTCNDCHEGTRMDFAALGYMPKAARNGKPLCTSCHGDESGEWSAAQFFTGVHRQHVTQERIDCSTCHNF